MNITIRAIIDDKLKPPRKLFWIETKVLSPRMETILRYSIKASYPKAISLSTRLESVPPWIFRNSGADRTHSASISILPMAIPLPEGFIDHGDFGTAGSSELPFTYERWKAQGIHNSLSSTQHLSIYHPAPLPPATTPPLFAPVILRLSIHPLAATWKSRTSRSNLSTLVCTIALHRFCTITAASTTLCCERTTFAQSAANLINATRCLSKTQPCCARKAR